MRLLDHLKLNSASDMSDWLTWEVKSLQDQAYVDRLSGHITPQNWQKRDAEWRQEEEVLVNEVGSLKDSLDERIQNGVALIELLKDSQNIWKKAAKEAKAKIIKTPA